VAKEIRTDGHSRSFRRRTIRPALDADLQIDVSRPHKAGCAATYPCKLGMGAAFLPDIDRSSGNQTALLGVESSRNHREHPGEDGVEDDAGVRWGADSDSGNGSTLHSRQGGRQGTDRSSQVVFKLGTGFACSMGLWLYYDEPSQKY